MRILRIRPGFQADHSSSSYLFYAVDQPVSAAGQRIAHGFSSRADVDEQFARYQKWGESSLSSDAYRALLSTHYDVMAGESYDSWTLMIAVPKTAPMQKLLRPFHDISDDFVRLDVHDYGKRLVVEVFCEFDYAGPVFSGHSDTLKQLTKLLTTIRGEILLGDVSFLEAVAEYYGAGEDEDEDAAAPPAVVPAEWTKAELQEECARRGVPVRKSWTKDQLRAALAAPVSSGSSRPARTGGQPKLSSAARRIVGSLTHQ